jgi:hypothetical protein
MGLWEGEIAMVAPPDNLSLYKSVEGHQKVMAHYDTTVQRMGIPYETEYVETRYGPTHVLICGKEEGKPVALWHGLNANSATWAAWIPALAPTYRVYAVDTIGGMGRSAPSRPSKKDLAYGQWAADTLRGLGLTQANWECPSPDVYVTAVNVQDEVPIRWDQVESDYRPAVQVTVGGSPNARFSGTAWLVR